MNETCDRCGFQSEDTQLIDLFGDVRARLCRTCEPVVATAYRHDRLASEGLTEEDIKALDRVALRLNAIGGGFGSVPNELAATLANVIAKLQAQLAAAKEAIAVAEGIAGDALNDRGLPRIEEVRRETATRMIEICREVSMRTGYSAASTAWVAAKQIAKEFGAKIGDRPESKHYCAMCNDTGRIMFTADADIDCPSCRPAGPDPLPHCRQCGGSGWDHIPEYAGGRPNCGACGGSGYARQAPTDQQYDERRDRRIEERTP